MMPNFLIDGPLPITIIDESFFSIDSSFVGEK